MVGKDGGAGQGLKGMSGEEASSEYGENGCKEGGGLDN